MQRTERSEQSPLPEIEKKNAEKCRETASIQIIHRSRNRPSVQGATGAKLACSVLAPCARETDDPSWCQ